MATKKKAKPSSGPKIFWIQDDDDNLSIYDYGNMAYGTALKKAKEIVEQSYADMRPCSVTIFKEVAEVKPKTEKVEVIVKEIK